MANSSRSKQCKCPIECDSISYSYYYVSTPFNLEEVCAKGNGNKVQSDFLMKDYYLNQFPPAMARKMRRIYRKESDKEKEICDFNSQYRAAIKFRLASDTMTVTVTSRRLSFFDKLSSVGM